MGKDNAWIATLDTALDDGFGDDMPTMSAHDALARIEAGEDSRSW